MHGYLSLGKTSGPTTNADDSKVLLCGTYHPQQAINYYISNFLSPYLCGYRKGFSTQLPLLSLTEKWKKALDNKGFGGAVLKDLSKAFDTINNDLLIAKLRAYDFDKSIFKLIFSYLNSRWHGTKIDQNYNSWEELLQAVSQGSVLSPLLFNIYLNDLFCRR